MTQRTFRTIRLDAMTCLALGWLILAMGRFPVRVEAEAEGKVEGQGPGAISWRQDFGLARAEAKAKNLPVWVQFTGPWCHFCDRMERESFVHPTVVGQARDAFIPVKLRSDVHEDLALHFGLSGLPATIILKPSGEVIAKQEGYQDPEAFQAFLRNTLSRHGLVRSVPKPAARPEAAEPGIALAGFCPVSLVRNHQLVPGQKALTLTRDGQVYHFANPLTRNTFQKMPEQFTPVNGGRCPVDQVDRGEARAGDPRWSVLYEGHLYLCSSPEGRQRFMQKPERYARVDVADRGFCPHCWAREGLLVRGSPRYSLTRAGWRYLFPDPGHLEAFKANPEITRR